MPLLLLAALTCVQALLLALSLLFAQTAADRSARGAPRAQALASMPSAWRPRAVVQVDSDRARVRLRPPAVIPGASRVLVVTASSSVTP